MEEEIETLIEGCFETSPGCLKFVEGKFEIFENVKVLHNSFNSLRYLFYGYHEEFFNGDGSWMTDKKRIGDMRNRALSINGNGFPLDKLWEDFIEVFDAQRSLITNDGRIYVEESFFSVKDGLYLNAVPRILEYASSFIDGETDEGYFSEQDVSLFEEE